MCVFGILTHVFKVQMGSNAENIPEIRQYEKNYDPKLMINPDVVFKID